MQLNHIFSWSVLYTALEVVIILLLAYITAQATKKLLDSYIKTITFIQMDPIHYRYIKSFLIGLIYFLGIILAIFAIPTLQNLAISLLASSGILALIVGFASQQAFSNIISGIFITFFKPFSLNDRIKVGSHISGVVEDITLRHTIIRTSENKHIIVPNATMNSEIIENSNWHQTPLRKLIPVYLSYESNIDQAIQLISNVLSNDSRCLENEFGKKRIEVEIIDLSTCGVHLQAAVWCKNETEAFYLASDTLRMIKEEFDKNGLKFAQYCNLKLN